MKEIFALNTALATNFYRCQHGNPDPGVEAAGQDDQQCHSQVGNSHAHSEQGVEGGPGKM